MRFLKLIWVHQSSRKRRLQDLLHQPPVVPVIQLVHYLLHYNRLWISCRLHRPSVLVRCLRCAVSAHQTFGVAEVRNQWGFVANYTESLLAVVVGFRCGVADVGLGRVESGVMFIACCFNSEWTATFDCRGLYVGVHHLTRQLAVHRAGFDEKAVREFSF